MWKSIVLLNAVFWVICFLILGAAGCGGDDPYQDYVWTRVADTSGVFNASDGDIFLTDMAEAELLGTSGESGYVLVGAERMIGDYLVEATLKAAVWTSPDGQTWTRLPDYPDVFSDDPGVYYESPSDYSMNAITRFGDKLVAVGRQARLSPFPHQDYSYAAAWVSEDGVLWIKHYIDELYENEVAPWLEHGPLEGPRDVAASDQEVVAVGSSADRGFIWRSIDGANWQRVFLTPAGRPALITSIVRTNTEFVAVGCYRDEGPALWRSTDALTWTEQRDFDTGKSLFGLSLQTNGWGWVLGKRTNGDFAVWNMEHNGQIESSELIGSSLTYPPWTSRSIHGNIGSPLIVAYHDDYNILVTRWVGGVVHWLSPVTLTMNSTELRAYANNVVSFQDVSGNPIRFVVGQVCDPNPNPDVGGDEGHARGAIWVWRHP